MALGKDKGLDQKITEDIQHKRDMRRKITDRGKIQVTTVRLHSQDVKDLSDYFKSRGTNFSNGLRILIRDFLIKEGII